MPNDRPVVFLAFANEQEGRRYLRDLPEESRQLQSILREAEDRGLCELVVRTNATLPEIDEVFRRHGFRVAVFHFAGHADADRLLMQSASGTTAAYAEGLAGYLGGQGGVKLVFLNGCWTRPQVAELLRKGIDVVLATARPIDDATARAFAADFYKQLVAGRTFRDAFERARDLAKTARGSSPRAFLRDLVAFDPEDIADVRGFPWDFQVRAGAQRTERTSLAELAGDPLLGLPALPPGGYLPPKPYPEPLRPFTARDAYVFFGRGEAIRALYELVRVSLNRFLREANRAWHGVKLHEPDWGDSSHSIALSAELREEGLLLHFILNAYWEPLEFELPIIGNGSPWRRLIDTALNSPHDIVPWQEAPPVPDGSYPVGARSVVMLFARSGSAASQ